MRLTLAILALLAVTGSWGCSHPSARPPNPILERSQANLQSVESRLQGIPAITHADYLKLGTARYMVWYIYLGRSRYSAGTAKARWEAAEYRRKAERLEPKVIEAFQRAMDQPPDPRIAARAMVRLSSMYAEIPDRDKQMGILKRILREHRDTDAPAVFGAGQTPHYYCYYTLAGIYQAMGERYYAIDALSRALLAIDVTEKAGKNVGNIPTQVLGRLLDYEPRIVLPQYQRLLPANINESPGTPNSPNRTGPAASLKRIFQSHRQTAPTRITLTVQHTDHNGLLVDYKVVFPDYPKIIETWRQEQQNPRPRLADDFRHVKPIFRLSFAAFPTTEGFGIGIPAYVTKALAPATATVPLVFDHHGRSSGRMILKWSDQTPRQLNLYLTAKLERGSCCRGLRWRPAVQAGEVYVKPVQVACDKDATIKPR